MSICLLIDEVVKFTVKGSFADRTGKDQPFSFTLTCDRVDVDVIEEHSKALAAGAKMLDFFTAPGAVEEHRTHGWSGVKDKFGADVPFSPDEMEKLFKLPGLPYLTWRRYLEEVQAKAKN